MPSKNETVIIGHLGQDPKVFADGRCLSISVACSEKFKNRNGEWKEQTTWVPVKWWSDKFAAPTAALLKKGSLVVVFGSFATDNYEKDGKKVYSQYIKASLVLKCEWPGSGQPSASKQQETNGEYTDADYNTGSNDDFPF